MNNAVKASDNEENRDHPYVVLSEKTQNRLKKNYRSFCDLIITNRLFLLSNRLGFVKQERLHPRAKILMKTRGLCILGLLYNVHFVPIQLETIN